MAYTKQTFTAGQTLKASDLNTMSQGIVDKQDKLVSGTSIKTLNGASLLGTGNLLISQTTSGGSSCWADMSAVFVGDSITYGHGTTLIYYNVLKDLLALKTVTGMGVGGSCFSTKSDYGTANSPLVTRYQNIPDADLIVVFMGTNDYGHETPMGTIEDTTDVSFYGAVNVVVKGIVEAHPTSRIVFCTPLHRYGFGTSKLLGTAFTYDHIKNGQDHTLKDYVDALKEVCERYSIPVIDLFSQSGLNPSISQIKDLYFPDGLHPNEAGHTKLAHLMYKYLNLYALQLPNGESVGGTGGGSGGDTGDEGDDNTGTDSSGVTLSYGNALSGPEFNNQKTRCYATKNIEIEAGKTVALKDSVNYLLGVYGCSSETAMPANSLLSDGWINMPYVTTSKHWYGFALKKADDSAFDFSTESNNLWDYITIS